MFISPKLVTLPVRVVDWMGKRVGAEDGTISSALACVAWLRMVEGTWWLGGAGRGAAGGRGGV